MKHYNTTDLDPENSFNRHIFHRDQFAHYLRWTHVLKEAKIGDTVCDFGCGSGALLEVFYRNKFKCKEYTGLDIREKTIAAAIEKYRMINWASFTVCDLTKDDYDYCLIAADKVCSFEVFEHVGKQNAQVFLKHFKECGHEDTTYYLSTPNYDPKVGAAGNHTYDSGDGRGVAVQEHTYDEIYSHIVLAGFKIVKQFGTFASIKDYKPYMRDWQKKMFDALSEYYDSNLLSNMMAPLFPQYSRNTLWVLKQSE